MYVWRNIKTIVGFDENMLSYRNAIVREINFAFSPGFRRIKEDESINNIHQTNRNLRRIAKERITDEVRTNTVKIKLIEEVLNPNPDFKAADLLIKYLDISTEDFGKDIYYTFKNKETAYSRFINEKRFKEAFVYLKYFTEGNALTEIKFLIDKAAESKSYKSFAFFIKKLFDPPYKILEKDKELKKILEIEFDNAESDRRLEDIELINKFLGNDEKWNRVKALKALLNRDYDHAIKYLEKIESKEKMQNLIIDCYWEEIENAKKEIMHLLNAFYLAFYGGLTDGEYREYIIYPAEKLFEHYVNKINAAENDYHEAAIFVKFIKPEDVKNILARKFLSLIQKNETSVAVKLKTLYKVDFSSADYDEKEKVLENYERLTETKGVFKIPKGEENLHTALDIAAVFDFEKDEIKIIHGLLCRFYISEELYDKAKTYFIPDDRLSLEFIENEISEFINEKEYNRIYEILDNLEFNFPDDIISKKKAEIIGIIVDKDYTLENLIKMIIIGYVFKLHILPNYTYKKVLDFCSENLADASEILMDLSIPLFNKADSIMKIRIYKLINDIKTKEITHSDKLEDVYAGMLHPTVIDWIIYLLRLLFRLQ